MARRCEAFLTSRLNPPTLFVKQGSTVVGVSVANVDPAATIAQLAELAGVILAASP